MDIDQAPPRTTERFRTEMNKMLMMFLVGVILLAGVFGITLGFMHRSFTKLVHTHAVILSVALGFFVVCLLDGIYLFLWYKGAEEDPSFRVGGRATKSILYASGGGSVALLYICAFVPHKFLWLTFSFVIELCVCYILGSMTHFNFPSEAPAARDDELMRRLRAKKYQLIMMEFLLLFGAHGGVILGMSFWFKLNDHSLLKEHWLILSIASFMGIVFFVGSLIIGNVYRKATEDPAERRLIRGASATLDAAAVTSGVLILIATYIPVNKWVAPLIVLPILCVVYILVRVFRPPTEGGEA